LRRPHDPELSMAVNNLAHLLLQGAAFHEAGHLTAAVLQKMPLLEQGINIYSDGKGCSSYCHRLPGDPASSEKDQSERTQTIIALYAGPASQRSFFADCPEDGWASDKLVICALLEEMYPNDPRTGRAAGDRLREKAGQLVRQHETEIRALVAALLSKTPNGLPQNGVDKSLARASKRPARWMSGSELVRFFMRFQIPSSVSPDCLV
jgi:hypothetical protein